MPFHLPSFAGTSNTVTTCSLLKMLRDPQIHGWRDNQHYPCVQGCNHKGGPGMMQSLQCYLHTRLDQGLCSFECLRSLPAAVQSSHCTRPLLTYGYSVEHKGNADCYVSHGQSLSIALRLHCMSVCSAGSLRTHCNAVHVCIRK